MPKYRSCVFCRRDKYPPSKEDIFAKWIAREWPNNGIFQIEASQDKIPYRTWGAKGNMGFVMTKPCEDCNNGWMSEFENNAKPILTELIWGRKCTVTGSDQLHIAKWMVKTAMMFEFYRGRSPRFFQPRHRQSLYQHRLVPHGTMVFIAHYSGGKDALLIDHDELIRLELAVNGTVYAGSGYSATFCIGQVALQIFAYRWPDDMPHTEFNIKVPGQWNEWSRQVYPTRSEFIWPIEFTLDNAAIDRFQHRWRELRP